MSARSLLVLGAMATTATGCYATAGTGGPPPPPPPAYQVTAAQPPGAAPVDEIAYEAPPAQIETYPSVVFEGQAHYYVNGRWFLHTQRGWGYRRHEPPQLAQHRPPPRREEEHREGRREERREERRDERR